MPVRDGPLERCAFAIPCRTRHRCSDLCRRARQCRAVLHRDAAGRLAALRRLGTALRGGLAEELLLRPAWGCGPSWTRRSRSVVRGRAIGYLSTAMAAKWVPRFGSGRRLLRSGWLGRGLGHDGGEVAGADRAGPIPDRTWLAGADRVRELRRYGGPNARLAGERSGPARATGAHGTGSRWTRSPPRRLLDIGGGPRRCTAARWLPALSDLRASWSNTPDVWAGRWRCCE